jgi:hypothetical protein
MRGDENVTAFVEFESLIFGCSDLIVKLAKFLRSSTPVKTSAITESALIFIWKRINSTIPRC